MERQDSLCDPRSATRAACNCVELETGRMSDADQCAQMCQEAAAVAVRRNGVSVEIRLLAEDGYHLWHWAGSVPAAMVELAAVPVVGGLQ